MCVPRAVKSGAVFRHHSQLIGFSRLQQYTHTHTGTSIGLLQIYTVAQYAVAPAAFSGGLVFPVGGDMCTGDWGLHKHSTIVLGWASSVCVQVPCADRGPLRSSLLIAIVEWTQPWSALRPAFHIRFSISACVSVFFLNICLTVNLQFIWQTNEIVISELTLVRGRDYR